MLRLRDIMTRDLVTVAPDVTLQEVIELFTSRHVSGAPVIAGGKIVGVISTTDLLDFAASTPGAPTERPPEGQWADDEEPDEPRDGGEPPATFYTDLWDDTSEDVAARFSVVARPEWSKMAAHTVDEVMNRTICALPSDATVEHAAGFMRSAGVRRVLVIDGDDLAGIVTTKDIADAVADHKFTARTYVFGPRSSFDARGW